MIFQKNPLSGLADVYMLLIIHLQGSTPMVVGWCERDHTSSRLRVIIRGLGHKQHGSRLHKPMCVLVLHYISVCVLMERIKKLSQDKKPLPKEVRNYNPFPKQYRFLLTRDPLTNPQSHEGEGHVLTPHQQCQWSYLSYMQVIPDTCIIPETRRPTQLTG